VFQSGLAALIASAGLLGPGSAALAQPQSPSVQIEVAQPQILVPQRWLTSPDLAQPVMVRTVDAKVEIRGRLATTTLTMELSNPSSRMTEAVLLLPVPEGASISAFGLNNGELKGEVLPIDEARRIYTEIVRRLVDPGLLEFVGTGAVRSSVFPVPAQGTQTVTLTYTHVLTGHGNRIDFELPRSQDPAAAQASWSIEVLVQPVERASRMEGHSEAFAAWSPSHEIETEPADKGLRVRVRNGNEPGPFRLSVIDANAGDPITLSLWLKQTTINSFTWNLWRCFSRM
jgi:Ca-activated chloride channel family protein